MRISGVGYSPYVYNANSISSVSMDPIDRIEEDVLSSGVDYSDLSGENENPLRMGESRNFADIIASQMAMSARNAARVMPQEDASSYMQSQNDEVMQEEVEESAQETTASWNPVDDTEPVEAMDELLDELTVEDMQEVADDTADNTEDKSTEVQDDVTGGMAVEQNQNPTMERMEPVGRARTDEYADQISLYQRLHAAQAYENMMAS